MITEVEARRVVEDIIADAFSDRTGDASVVVIDDLTVARDYGWIFIISTAEFRRTRNPRQGLVGAGPILVLRDDGSYIEFSSRYDSSAALEAYESDPSRFTPRKVFNG